MFRKMPILLLALIGLILSLDRVIPISVKSVLYALSLSVKSVIIFILPMLIFMLIFKTISQLSKNATKLIGLILLGICCSNFLSTMISYLIGSSIYKLDLSIATPQGMEGLMPAWSFHLPKLIANDHALFAGILLGLFFAFFKKDLGQRLSHFFDQIVAKILACITYAIPLFIAGFVIKLIHDQTLNSIARDYSIIFLVVAASQFAYIALIYLLTSQNFISAIRNMLPAAIAGFSTMSSAAAMPLTLIGTEKNGGRSAQLSIPVTVNVHLIGDCFAIPIFAFAVLKNFGMAEPTFLAYLIFALYFVLAKFSVAGIPGGGIIVMLPILESQLGFTGEMASLITALYILFDPVITCANVTGNGGFALALSKLRRLKVSQ